jgi:DNA-binding MarR family transcriptional regulator
MDAVIFHVKGGHLAVQRFARRALRSFGLTPARFDLMKALGDRGMRQSDLWKRLNVVRSVVCEMVRALGRLGWVARVRAPDSRTWTVRLTKVGRAVFERAYDACVENGNVAVAVDAALCEEHLEIDWEQHRLDIIHSCDTLDAAFRAMPWFRGPDLYLWDPEDYYFMLTDAEDRDGDLPFVDTLDLAEA